MQRTLRSITSLTVASLKMYLRNRTGLFFTLFIPVVLVGVFGLFGSSDGSGSIALNLNDQAHTQLSQQFVSSIKDVKAFKVTTDSESAAKDKLAKGNLDLEVVIPPEFGQAGQAGLKPAKVVAQYNSAKPGNGQTAGLIIGQILDGFNSGINHTPQVLSVDTVGVKTNNLTYIDFLLPGIVGLSIMQIGIFSVAFAFVSYKTTGALRRIQATPTHPMNFIIGQSITRLLVSLAQVLILVALGVHFFHFTLVGSWMGFLVIAALGSLTFLAFGFAIAGYAKDENQAAPIAQLIQFPMMFLSGTFFPRDSFPHWLQRITDYFPLTYLADALRKVANEGTSLTHLGGDILGLVVWGIIAFIITLLVFRWE